MGTDPNQAGTVTVIRPTTILFLKSTPMHAGWISERRDEIRSYNFHGLMMGMLLGVKSFSFLVASVKLCV